MRFFFQGEWPSRARAFINDKTERTQQEGISLPSEAYLSGSPVLRSYSKDYKVVGRMGVRDPHSIVTWMLCVVLVMLLFRVSFEFDVVCLLVLVGVIMFV